MFGSIVDLDSDLHGDFRQTASDKSGLLIQWG